MRAWDTFYPDVLPDVLGCPEPTVDRHLLRAAQDFCVITKIWREDLDPIITAADTALYDLNLPRYAEAVKLVGASLNGRDIGLDVADGSTASRLAGNRGPVRVRTTDLLTVTILPTPAADLSLVITAILKPSDSATGVEDAIADNYRAIIATGALATLLTINKAEWRNDGLAERKQARYERDRNRVKIAAWKAFTSSSPRVRAQYF